MRLGWLGLSLGFASLLGCGSGAKGDCLPFASCGGNPAGTWQVTGPASACQVPVVRPQQPASDVTDFAMHTMPLAPTIAPPQPNPVLATQTTSGDWCSGLSYTPSDEVMNVNLWHDAPKLVGGTIKLFDADGSYLTLLNFEDQNTTHFPPRCILQNGGGHPDKTTGFPAAGTCTTLAGALNKYYMDGRVNPTVPPNFSDVTCADAADHGCTCAYKYTVQVDDSGTWAIPPGDPTTLMQESAVFTYNAVQVNSEAPAKPMKSSFCANGNQLLLSGPDGHSLFTLQGLRTLALQRM